MKVRKKTKRLSIFRRVMKDAVLLTIVFPAYRMLNNWEDIPRSEGSSGFFTNPDALERLKAYWEKSEGFIPSPMYIIAEDSKGYLSLVKISNGGWWSSIPPKFWWEWEKIEGYY